MNIYLTAFISQIVLTFVPVAIKYTQANIYTIGFTRLIIAVLLLSLSSSKNFSSNIRKIWLLVPTFYNSLVILRSSCKSFWPLRSCYWSFVLRIFFINLLQNFSKTKNQQWSLCQHFICFYWSKANCWKY